MMTINRCPRCYQIDGQHSRACQVLHEMERSDPGQQTYKLASELRQPGHLAAQLDQLWGDQPQRLRELSQLLFGKEGFEGFE